MGYLKHQEIEAMEPKPHEWDRRWIPVDESLPDDGAKVLVAYLFPPSYSLRFIKDPVQEVRYEICDCLNGRFWFEDDCVRYERSDATHWMELPKPPKVT